ncbi:MAG: hypothetical protein HYZ47_00520 [Simkania negevensis]|nr:hypothetical protein [Simkania negevensis]
MTTTMAHIKEKDSRDVIPTNVIPTADTSKELTEATPTKEARDPAVTASSPDNLKKGLRRLKRRGDAEYFGITRILDQSANQILLKSQLLLAISHILFLIQKTYCEAQERLARNTLNK